MKLLILLLTVAISFSAHTAPTHSVELDEYLFVGTLAGMTNSLERQLAEEIKALCPETSGKLSVRVKKLNIDFRLGELTEGTKLPVEVSNQDDPLFFSHHPKATIKASFECE